MIKLKYQLAALVLAGSFFTSCSDDVVVGNINETNYEISDGSSVGYIIDSQGKRMFTTLEFRNTGSETLTLNANKALKNNVSVTAAYDQSVLDEYNKKNNSDFKAFPEADVTLSDGGVITLTAGQQTSSVLSVTTKSDGKRSYKDTYAIPLRMKVTSGGVKLPVADQTRVVFVKDLTALPTATKYVNGEEGVKVFSCMEVNDCNPLNNLCFTLKGSGKPLVDAVILFSSNINYDAATGRVHLFHNENCTAILNNYNKYIKPLKDRGIKVILSILGNHDISGVANLSDETARDFAREVKACCDAYNLDGVMLDDEYSNYEGSDVTPGFVSPSRAACARLYYEMKKIMPDRWMIAYVYSTTSSLPAVDGVQSGNFIDYALHDYGGSSDLTNNYPGMPVAHWGLYSQEFGQSRFADESDLQDLVKRGSKTHMIFGMNPYLRNSSSQISSMRKMAKIFYNDELVVSDTFYPKDWN